MRKILFALGAFSVFAASAQPVDHDSVHVVLGHRLDQSKPVSVQRMGAMSRKNAPFAAGENRRYPPVDVVEIDRQGMTDREIVEAIYATGLYEHVEIYGQFSSMESAHLPDVPFTTSDAIHKGPDYEQFSDPWWPAQRGSHYRLGDTAMSSGLAGVMARSGEAGQGRYPVFVLDSGFSRSDDVPYADGRNFVSFGSTGYQDDPYNYSPRGEVQACDGHGLVVAGVLAAGRGNGAGIAGIAAHADIHALRVMQCGSGNALDTINALFWLAGVPVDNQPDVYSGKPGVVNMSLGGPVHFAGSTGIVEGVPTCGVLFQSAVDAAIEAGFTLVAAAGNDAVDAWNIAPASCEGVITVGAIDVDGKLADFSNTGSLIDVNAPGEYIFADGTPYGEPEEVHMRTHSGTSFSTPIVAGLIAETQRHHKLTPGEARMLIRQTSFDPTLRESERCKSGKCGPGRLDGEAFFLASKALGEGRLHHISYALNSDNSDEQNWLHANFASQYGACDAYRVEFFNGHRQPEQTYRLVESFKGANFESDGFNEIGRFTSANVVVRGMNADDHDYAFQVCTQDGACDGEWYIFNTTAAQSSAHPTVCTG